KLHGPNMDAPRAFRSLVGCSLATRNGSLMKREAPHGIDSAETPISILLVDDQPANLLALCAILDELGHDLVEAHSGEEAVAKARGRDFALILLAVQMPGLSGFETARQIRAQERSARTPIIFVSAHESA